MTREKATETHQALKSLPREAWVRQRQLLEYVPFSKATLWREVAAGRFPKPVKLSPATTAWRWGDVLDELERRAAS